MDMDIYIILTTGHYMDQMNTYTIKCHIKIQIKTSRENERERERRGRLDKDVMNNKNIKIKESIGLISCICVSFLLWSWKC